ncbi:hypothetical protein HK097_010863 [Rhizophlyctis rosea]|uniref:Uncharacterized protein n=1 Tax=Rhizophlyctis rosea TaxID=64517 RepID=A0AAD5S9S1_9FUNG|nr:hypothetical protein HK097_010863 [Rhizophlyctis rosea]
MTIYNGKSLFELIGFEKRTRFMGFSFAKETLEVGLKNAAELVKYVFMYAAVKHELVNEVDDGLHPALMKRVGQSDVYEVHTTKIMHVLLSTFVDFLPLIYDVVYNGPAEFKELDEIKAFFP